MFNFLQERAEALPKKGGEGRVTTIIDNLPSLYWEIQESPPGGEQVRRFKSLISDALTNGENFKHLRSYINQCHRFAERGRLDGFESACSMRSSLKILDQKFLNWGASRTPENKNLFDEDIAYIDEILEEVSDEAPPVREKDIPEWADQSHWWWWAPKCQDMSEAERYDRIHYEELGLW